MISIIWFLTISTELFLFVLSDHKIIETPLGHVRGFETWSFGNTLFYSFLGIPYAQPPIGQLRLRPPEAIEPWNGIFEADRHSTCLQIDHNSHFGVKGSEDCLVVSVYTPRINQTLLPVFVWLHGNEFHKGSGNADLHGPNRIMDYNVVMVTMNFRLGPLGFMTLEDEELPGNIGLLDQKMALEWIQLNIASFGGDPAKITIAGSGAGGVSAILHYLSPQSKGLFRSVISFSGTPLAPTMSQTKLSPSYYTKALAEKLGCDISDASSAKIIMECLCSKSAESIAKNSIMFAKNINFAPMPFHPIVDNFSSKPFLPLEPLEALESRYFNDVPLIVGHNKHESMNLLMPFMKNETKKKKFVEDWPKIGPAVLFNRIQESINNEEKEVLKLLNQRYFQNDNISEDLNLLEVLITDSIHVTSTSLFALQAAKYAQSSVYQYHYSHPGSLCLAEIQNLTFWQILAKFFGRYLGLDLYSSSYQYASQNDDQLMIFNTNSLPFDGAFTENDKKISRTLLQLWTNFVKNGHNPSLPNFKWIPLNEKHVKLDIDTRGLSMVPINYNLLKFWYTNIWPEFPPKMYSQNIFNWKLDKVVDINKDEL